MAFFWTILGDSFCLTCTLSLGILFSYYTKFQKIPWFQSLPYLQYENLLSKRQSKHSEGAVSLRGRDHYYSLKVQSHFTNVIASNLCRCNPTSRTLQILSPTFQSERHKKLMGPPLISGVPLTNTKTKLDLTKLFSRYHHDNYLVQI